MSQIESEMNGIELIRLDDLLALMRSHAFGLVT